MQFAAACALTGITTGDHILPPASLHWLPVKFRLEYKITHLTYKVLSGWALSYLKELIVLNYQIRALLFQNTGLNVVPGV